MTSLVNAYFTDVILEIGINSKPAGLASLQASALAIAQEFTDAGLRVFACTLTPDAPSIDGSTTLGNQTPSAYEATAPLTMIGYGPRLPRSRGASTRP